jgi:hypothetical protein
LVGVVVDNNFTLKALFHPPISAKVEIIESSEPVLKFAIPRIFTKNGDDLSQIA